MSAAAVVNVPRPEEAVSVLLVSPVESDCVSLRNIISCSNWNLHRCTTYREAVSFLRRHRIGVVICEYRLPDGDWKTLLDEIESRPAAPCLIVASRLADSYLWGEVLNLGGYDVLPTPFDKSEVVRVVSLAWLHWRNARVVHRRDASRERSSHPMTAAAVG